MVTLIKPTEKDRLRELLVHAREGSPIAMESVRSQLCLKLTNAGPDVLLALAERLMEVEEEIRL